MRLPMTADQFGRNNPLDTRPRTNYTDPINPRKDTTMKHCYCGQPATTLVDSDSIQFQNGQPVCDEHAEDRDPVEERII